MSQEHTQKIDLCFEKSHSYQTCERKIQWFNWLAGFHANSPRAKAAMSFWLTVMWRWEGQVGESPSRGSSSTSRHTRAISTSQRVGVVSPLPWALLGPL